MGSAIDGKVRDACLYHPVGCGLDEIVAGYTDQDLQLIIEFIDRSIEVVDRLAADMRDKA